MGGTSVSERRFQRVLGSLNTRESSTLVIATVASSASLVLLGFDLTERISEDFAGFFFPIAGLLYRELTIFTVDALDLDELSFYAGGTRDDSRRWMGMVSHFRRFILRVLLASPSALWLTNRIYPDLYHVEGPRFLWPFLVIVVVCVALGYAEAERNRRLRMKRGAYTIPSR